MDFFNSRSGERTGTAILGRERGFCQIFGNLYNPLSLFHASLADATQALDKTPGSGSLQDAEITSGADFRDVDKILSLFKVRPDLLL